MFPRRIAAKFSRRNSEKFHRGISCWSVFFSLLPGEKSWFTACLFRAETRNRGFYLYPNCNNINIYHMGFLFQYLNSSFSLLFQLLKEVKECDTKVGYHMDRVKRIWYLLPMRAAKVQASLRICAAHSYKQWVKRNLQTESQIPGPSEWLGMRS